MSNNPFNVIITTSGGLNLVFSNKRVINTRSYSHFVSADEGLLFANELEKVINEATYSNLDKCACCGEYFTKKDGIYSLKGDTMAHMKCFVKAVRNKQLEWSDKCDIINTPFKYDEPEYNFSNFYNQKKGFSVSVQVISETVIHIYCSDDYGCKKNHFCFTLPECKSLINEIRAKLVEIEKSKVGKCLHCKRMVYTDHIHYKTVTGEIIHANCMDEFIQSENAATITLPMKKVRLIDCFGHARIFKDMYYTQTF
jgi:hypothetical protein